jgi:hypothetical protein
MLEQWLLRIQYEPFGSKDFEECVYWSKGEATAIAKALLVDYPGARIVVLDAAAAASRTERWTLSVWFADVNEVCDFTSLAEAREYAQSVAADYQDGVLDVTIQQITITDCRGRIEYVPTGNMPIAV